MKLNRIYPLLFFIIIIYGCSKDNSSILVPVYTPLLKDFPNTNGTWWAYFYYDSLSNYSDTVIVNVFRDTLVNNEALKLWKIYFRNRTETNYVKIRGDTLRIYDDLQTYWITSKYVFPLELGNGWKGDFISDTNQVIDKTNIKIKAGTFSNSFLIKETWKGFNASGQIKTWFVPGIGVVKKHFTGGNFDVANIYWELISFNIQK